VAGPDDANHLFIIDGQLDTSLAIGSQGANFAVAKETFSGLVGPKLTNRQFVRAIATASIVNTRIANITPGGFATWNIVDVDADWDDESGQVELRIEAQVSCLGSNRCDHQWLRLSCNGSRGSSCWSKIDFRHSRQSSYAATSAPQYRFRSFFKAQPQPAGENRVQWLQYLP
jgi:hypothetical protein